MEQGVTMTATQVPSGTLDAVPELREPSRLRMLRDRLRPLTPTQARIAITVITLAAATDYLWRSLTEQARYLTTGYDLGIFDQAVRAYSHFQAPMVPLKGSGYNIFGDHFHPIIALLAPLYWIWDSPNTLLVAQALVTACAIPVVYRFTRRRAGAEFSLVVALTFAFSWPIQALIDFDFHEIAFATPFAALAIDALDRRDDRKLLLWCALLLLVREDMGILVAILGVLRLLQRRPNRRLVLALIGGGILAYGLITQLVIPHFAAGHDFAYANQFGSLGPTLSSAALHVVTQPWHAVAVFFTPWVKTQTLLLLLVPLLLLPFRSPYALLAAPLLAERFFNSRTNLWGPTFHYNALPWLIFTLAAIDGAGRLGLFDENRRAMIGRRVVAGVMVATPIFLIIWPIQHVIPLDRLRPGYATQPSTWLADAKAVTAFIPDNVCVAADNRIVPHLTARDWTTVVEAQTPWPDFYVIDLNAPDTGGNPPAPKPYPVLYAEVARGYTIAFRAGSFIVLQAPHYSGPSSACRPLGPGK
jgi:uncharacterized membrane protein